LGCAAPFFLSSFVDSLAFARFEGLGSVVGRADLEAEAPLGPSLRFKEPIVKIWRLGVQQLEENLPQLLPLRNGSNPKSCL
jgi:hypothetical protein